MTRQERHKDQRERMTIELLVLVQTDARLAGDLRTQRIARIIAGRMRQMLQDRAGRQRAELMASLALAKTFGPDRPELFDEIEAMATDLRRVREGETDALSYYSGGRL